MVYWLRQNWKCSTYFHIFEKLCNDEDTAQELAKEALANNPERTFSE